MRWRVRLDRGLFPDVTVVVRMDRFNLAARENTLRSSLRSAK